MENLKSILNQNFWLIVIVWLAVVASLVFWISSSPSDQEILDQTAANQSVEANKAVREAMNARDAAVNVSVERRTEDAARERIIKPKLDNARRQSRNSKAALEAARKTYNDKKSNTENLSASNADNCAALGRLFPNVRFDDCAGN